VTRRISDPDTLKGLAQPLRRKIYRQLVQFGPLTVSDIGKRVGADPGQTSYHLRELAKRGFVEDVPELARDRRERWFQAVPGSTSWSSLDFSDPEGTAIANTVKSQMVIGEFESLRRYEQTSGEWSDEWQNAASSTDAFFRLTPAELAQLNRELLEVIERWGGTRSLPLEGDRHSVFFFFHSFPERS
jgi:DNA-binding transcriptional ArsR family regulator